MAFDPGPCGPQFEDWEDDYTSWQSADSAANSAAIAAAAATATALAVCGGTWWTGVGLAACAIATATALLADGVSVDASLDRNAAREKLDASANAYEHCVGIHHNYYGKQP